MALMRCSIYNHWLRDDSRLASQINNGLESPKGGLLAAANGKEELIRNAWGKFKRAKRRQLIPVEQAELLSSHYPLSRHC